MKYKGIELTPIRKIQAFEKPREMLVWFKEWKKPRVELVSGIIRDNIGDLMVVSPCCDNWDFCSEIPQPTMRGMNKDEIRFYLWERNKTECIEVSYRYSDFESCFNFSFVNELEDYTFAVNKNGELTEFKLPQVEVDNE